MYLRLIAPLIAGAALLLAPFAAGAAEVPAQWKRAWPQTDFSRIEVDPAEIFSGGPGKDGIPAITGPEMIAAGAEDGLDPLEPVRVLERTGRHERAVLEMGMYAQGEIRTLCEIAKPQVGIVTNVGPAHLERLGSLEAIASAKAELPESLPAHGFAVFNADDPLVMTMVERTKAQPVTYGTAQGADTRATDIQSKGLEGVSFLLHWQGATSRAETKLPGRHIVLNALAAAAVALTDGMTLMDVTSALAQAEPPLRVRTHRATGGATIIDDVYNAGPAWMAAALDLRAEIPGRRIAVLGDMRELGPTEREEHRAVGRRAAESADVIHAVGDLGELIAEAARAEGHRDTHHWPTKEAAGEAVAADLRADDVVLVKASRAMEFETLVDALKD